MDANAFHSSQPKTKQMYGVVLQYHRHFQQSWLLEIFLCHLDTWYFVLAVNNARYSMRISGILPFLFLNTCIKIDPSNRAAVKNTAPAAIPTLFNIERLLFPAVVAVKYMTYIRKRVIQRD